MAAYEVMTSESQERMLAIVTPADLERVQAVCRRWEVRAEVVGRDVFAYLRSGSSETVLVAVNFGRAPGWVRLQGHPGSGAWSPLFGTHGIKLPGQADGAKVELRPLEAVVWLAM